jgi:hypothetical protein
MPGHPMVHSESGPPWRCHAPRGRAGAAIRDGSMHGRMAPLVLNCLLKYFIKLNIYVFPSWVMLSSLLIGSWSLTPLIFMKSN